MPNLIKWTRDKKVLHITTSCDTNKECVECCNEILDVLRRKTASGREFLIFMDWTKVNAANVKCVPSVVKFMRDNKENNRQSIRGSAIVMASSGMRAMLNMCFALQKPVTDIKLFKTHQNAYEYINTQTNLMHVQ